MEMDVIRSDRGINDLTGGSTKRDDDGGMSEERATTGNGRKSRRRRTDREKGIMGGLRRKDKWRDGGKKE